MERLASGYRAEKLERLKKPELLGRLEKLDREERAARPELFELLERVERLKRGRGRWIGLRSSGGLGCLSCSRSLRHH